MHSFHKDYEMLPNTLVVTLSSTTISIKADTPDRPDTEARLVPVSYSVFNHRLDGHTGTHLTRPTGADSKAPASSLM